MSTVVRAVVSILVAGVAVVLIWAAYLQATVAIRTTKICQVTGAEDRELPDRKTGTMLTGLTGGVTGTDLGFPFEHRGRLVLLFGDSREFHPDRCEPAWCGPDDNKQPAEDPAGRLKRWRTQADWDAWIRVRAEGADSIATAPLDFDPDRCIPVSFESDERGSVYYHKLAQNSVSPARRFTRPEIGGQVANRPEDKWVTVVGNRLVVVTGDGRAFAHTVFTSEIVVDIWGGRPFVPIVREVLIDEVGAAVPLPGDAVGARSEDRWVLGMDDRLLVGTSDGRVFAHRVNPTNLAAPYQLTGRIPTASDDRVMVAGNQVFIVTARGRVFAHTVSGDTIGGRRSFTGTAVAARREDKWVLATNDNRLLVVTEYGDAFVHSIAGAQLQDPFRLSGPFVGANPQDRQLLMMDDRILVLTRQDGRFRSTTLDGAPVGRQEGAIGAVTAGDRIYAFFTMRRDGHAHDDPEPGGRSVLSESNDGGRTFQSRAQVSTAKFLWTVPVVQHARSVPGLPPHLTGEVVFIWGAGRRTTPEGTTPFHHSYPFLAVAPLSSLADMSGWRYYSETPNGQRIWVTSEEAAVPVRPFGSPGSDARYGPGYHECLGYFTVHRIEAWGRWAMAYPCDSDTKKRYNGNNGPRGIYLRTAETPWGPWSEPRLAFEPGPRNGYCHFMYNQRPWECAPGAPNPAEESVRDLDVPKGEANKRGWGAEYAPILLPSRYAKVTADQATLYFFMGTWNPYQVVLMKMEVTPVRWVRWLERLRTRVK